MCMKSFNINNRVKNTANSKVNSEVTNRTKSKLKNKVRSKTRMIAGKALFNAFALTLGILFLFPFIIMLFGSISESVALSENMFYWIPKKISFENFRLVFERKNFIYWIINSIILSVVPMICTVLTSVLLGYIFAKRKFPGKDIIFWVFLSMIMVPQQALVVPRYLMFSRINWIDTYKAMLIPYIWDIMSFFYMKQYMQAIPDAIEEAAIIDGCGQFQTVLRIILPICKPGMASIATLRFVSHWNAFFYPLVFLTQEKKFPLTVGLASIMSESPAFNFVMAGAVMNFLPTFLVFILLQKYFINGVTSSAVKG
jgi:multiple sugar transport system permease protein